MPSLRSRIARLAVKYAVKPAFNPRWRVTTQRRLLRLASAMMKPPRGTQVDVVDASGVSGEWICHEKADLRRVLLYLHGGAYITGSPRTHRALAARLSRLADARVFLLDYRLAPEYPFPAALDDTLAAYRWLSHQGYTADNTLVAGDSAGGGLAVAALTALRDSGYTLPRRAYCLSPWVDLEMQGGSIRGQAAADPMLTRTWLDASARMYAKKENPAQPLISPLNAGLQALPPLLIQVGSDEILLSDAQRLAEKARAAGVEASLDVWDSMWHVWPMFAGYVPESDRALSQAGLFLKG